MTSVSALRSRIVLGQTLAEVPSQACFGLFAFRELSRTARGQRLFFIGRFPSQKRYGEREASHLEEGPHDSGSKRNPD